MLSYRAAGVDIDKATQLKKRIKSLARVTFDKNVLSEIGHFGGLYALRGYRKPVLVSSTDSVGTKLKIAQMMNKHTTVGADIVNHCCNDILTLGAKPLFFLDYLGYSEVENRILQEVVAGIANACKVAGCALIGGETAQLPGFYKKGEYDLVGFVLGVVERGEIIDGSRIKAGDRLIGLTASGLHTNGYSLARKIFFDRLSWKPDRTVPELKTTIGAVLLKTHRSYGSVVKPVLNRLSAIAHITGGGFYDNLGRLVRPGLSCVIEKASWQVPPLFRLIQHYGALTDREMFRVFNMGVGMVLFVNRKSAAAVISKLGEGFIIGEVVRGEHKVQIV
jgi:phosphoribosylformylglycinamidine cyclo-ligase